MENTIALVILIVIVAVIICLQAWKFSDTFKRINDLFGFFPETDDLEVKPFRLAKYMLKDKEELDKFVENPSEWTDYDESQKNTDEYENYMKVSLICMKSSADKDKHSEFMNVVHKTNVYLCKNVGTSADFELIKDICERRIEIIEGEIQNTLNAPLYMGLGGTFLGIITGVFGVNIKKLQGGDISSISGLLQGVGIAMLASFIGLALTVFNSIFRYRAASAKIDTDKDNYYDFIQRELMPTLSTSVASSLNALKSVLGNFVDSFGGNLDKYTQSISTLNENIKNEKEVLQEINKLNLTSTATKMAKTFDSLKDAADSLEVFKSYEQSLSAAMNGTAATLQRMNDTVDEFKSVKSEFKDFSHALRVAVQNQDKATQLQMQFKNAIEQNFPSGSAGREIWEKEYDELFKASKKMSDDLSEQLKESSKYISNFVESNKEFFGGISQLQQTMQQLANYAGVQSSCYNDLKKEINEMRKDNRNLQAETASMNKSILEAIQLMTATIKSLR